MSTEPAAQVAQHGSGSIVETAAYIITRDSVFGVLLVCAIIALVWMTKKLMETHDKRVSDLQSINKSVEDREAKHDILIDRMNDMFATVKVALELMTAASKDAANRLAEQADLVHEMKQVMDSVMRDAMRTAVRAPFTRTPTPPPTSQSPSDNPGRR